MRRRTPGSSHSVATKATRPPALRASRGCSLAPRPRRRVGACWLGFTPEHFVLCGAVVNGAILSLGLQVCTAGGFLHRQPCRTQ